MQHTLINITGNHRTGCQDDRADDGRIVHEWAWGKWVDRSRLAYVGIDETIEIGGMP